jgi:hypothetical protein
MKVFNKIIKYFKDRKEYEVKMPEWMIANPLK